MTDTGEVIEFCDPRIQTIKQTIEEIFGIEIHNHSLYFYATKKSPLTPEGGIIGGKNNN
jgi:Fur family ferric uptake transcriptional regulator